ncbi:MAG: formate dehydrogenase accessory protein FdhE [Candidatus Rokubacteria bacterium]|nr:formate dehydrogenase accessory protein FdhE [Candidatus Rokubacteria bacterium]
MERRPTFREPLAPYGKILDAWAQWCGDRVAPLRWSAEDCRERWRRGDPLLAAAVPSIRPEEMEDLLAPAIEFLVTIGREETALARFAEAWDRGDVSPAALFPEKGRIGSAAVQERSGLSQEFVAFLAHASLRPILESYFADCRPHLTDSPWNLGVCPFCGGPPGFADLLEGGQRRLACHLCGAGWTFPRLECAYCGGRNAKDLAVLRAEEQEEGYSISTCKACNGYVKEVDRRLRWNAGSALVEDWGSPHLDLIAHRAGYWRAIPTLIQLEEPA